MSSIQNSYTFNCKNGSLFTKNTTPSNVEKKILALLSRLNITIDVIEDGKQIPLNAEQLKLVKEVLPENVHFKIDHISSPTDKSIGNLPDEIHLMIAAFLNQSDLSRLGKSCSFLYRITQDAHLWRSPEVPSSFDQLQLFLCKHGAKIKELNLCSKLKYWNKENQIKLLKSLHLYCPNLTHLDLRGNFIGSEGAEALAEALPNLQTLTHLDLGSNYICFNSEIAIAISLKNPLNSLQVALSHIDIGSYIEGVKALAEALSKLQAFEYLILRSNTIGAEEAQALAETLSNLQTLKHLDLSFNTIGNEGAKALAEELSKLQVLAHLNLRFNGIGSEEAKALNEKYPNIVLN